VFRTAAIYAHSRVARIHSSNLHTVPFGFKCSGVWSLIGISYRSFLLVADGHLDAQIENVATTNKCQKACFSHIFLILPDEIIERRIHPWSGFTPILRQRLATHACGGPAWPRNLPLTISFLERSKEMNSACRDRSRSTPAVVEFSSRTVLCPSTLRPCSRCSEAN
jgi:hypothetical protein